MSRVPKVAFFDSGVGGLSVLSAVQRRLPGAQLAYACDNEHFPYGVRADDDVIKLTTRACRALCARFEADVLVVACNTASTVSLPALREVLACSVVGVVPAIKPAAAMSRSKSIGLLATTRTVQRTYTKELIQKFAGGCRVFKSGSTRLVELAEEKLRGLPVAMDEVAAEIAPLFAQSPTELHKRLDTIVLGCTHFPLLEEELIKAAPWPVSWIDSGEAIAARVMFLLEAVGLVDAGLSVQGEMLHRSFVTKIGDQADALVPALRGFGVAAPESLFG